MFNKLANLEAIAALTAVEGPEKLAALEQKREAVKEAAKAIALADLQDSRPRRYRHGGQPNEAVKDILKNGRRFTDSRGQSYRKFGGTVVREQ